MEKEETNFHKVYLLHLSFNFFLPPTPIADKNFPGGEQQTLLSFLQPTLTKLQHALAN